MRRLLGLLLAALVATPAAAQDAKPAWAGVWGGKVGSYPVRLCIDVWGDGPARGAYYYLSQLEPISLTGDEGEGAWTEHGPDGPDAQWSFTEQTAARLAGTWTRGERKLGFDLKPLGWTEGEWGGPCASATFMAPRVSGGTIEEAADPSEPGIRRFTYHPPRHFADEVSVETFTLAEEQPGDALINAWLEAFLPEGKPGDDFAECVAGSIATIGADGFYSETLAPQLVTRAFVDVEQSSGDFCGGAHPNYYSADHVFDRATGEQVDLFGWLGDARPDGEDSVIPDKLRELVIARWPEDPDSECREIAAEAEYWSLGLTREGMIFRPDLPHVATACEEPVVVEWQALAPFLDNDGREGLARLRD